MKPITKLRVRAHGTIVFVAINDDTFLELEWRKADEVASVLRQVARVCEEQEKAEQIARDAGLLLRAGAPFGLTNDPKIQAEAAKIAAWDSQFRRALPGGIKSEEQVGTPSLIQHPKH